MIRLFTSGTHNGLNFNNAQITDIANKTQQQGAERIPFVLGHPKNDLPIIGFLPRAAIELYQEAGKVSIGFDRDQADFSEESLGVLRDIGNNKISVRLEEGIIKHIGLVKKAAVAENNQQDFAEGLTGDYHTNEDFMEKPVSRFPNPLNFFKTNKTKSMEKENENTQQQPTDFGKLEAAVERNCRAIEKLTGILASQQTEKEKAAITSDFSAPEYDHLTDEQKQQAADFCAALPEDQREPYKKMLQGIKQKQDTPPAGSVTAEFGAKEQPERTAEDLIRDQVKGL